MYEWDGDEYQLQPPHVGFINQVLLQVQAVHILVDETERMCVGRVYPHERCYVYTFVVKEGPYVNFIVKPL